MRNSNQISFLQLFGFLILPVILFSSIYGFQTAEVQQNESLELIGKSISDTVLNFKERVESAPPEEPQEVIEEIIFDVVTIDEEYPLVDTVELALVEVVTIDECKCIPNYHPIRLIEMDEEEEIEAYSILPEPIYIDPSIFEAKVYPNPAINFSNLELTVAFENNFDINLYDMSGQLVQNIFTGFLNTGRQKFEIDLYNLVAGMYIVQVTSAEQNETFKLQIN